MTCGGASDSSQTPLVHFFSGNTFFKNTGALQSQFPGGGIVLDRDVCRLHTILLVPVKFQNKLK